ncbi:hypothetical protein ACFWZW_04600 [Microbacterium enclense]|uniref:hypothetical protein n=1 Tax=Microbacterium enclense TaxID=993073 RepID=UPI0036D9D399
MTQLSRSLGGKTQATNSWTWRVTTELCGSRAIGRRLGRSWFIHFPPVFVFLKRSGPEIIIDLTTDVDNFTVLNLTARTEAP